MCDAAPAASRSASRWRWIRRILLAAAILLVAAIARPLWHLASAMRNDRDEREVVPAGMIDDASRLNQTAVTEVWPIPAATALAEEQLGQLLRRAGEQGLTVSIAGARHSMGGHTFSPDGLVIDMLPFHAMELDAERNILHVQAGARWSEVIPFLDRRGRSVAVMQSDNTFSVGGSLSVNCHGWQHGKPPISSTVERFRLMRADGRIVTCSREQNRELFSLVLGGYGLFGVILDADLQVVSNERYRLEQFIVPVDQALATYERTIAERPAAQMVYARMSIVPDRFLGEVILNIFTPDPAADESIPALTEAGLGEVRRSLFRGSAGSDYGKELRWNAEARLQPHLAKRHYSRNQLLNEGSDTYQNRTADTTDILHEYFIPREGVVAFVTATQRIVPEHKGDLLNVTVRSIDTDDDTFLRYADGPMISFVMLFVQPRTFEGDARMEAMTQALVEAALAAGGRYYLPYRLHATLEQFRRAYPQADRFFEHKLRHDPQELFQNGFYRKYAKNL